MYQLNGFEEKANFFVGFCTSSYMVISFRSETHLGNLELKIRESIQMTSREPLELNFLVVWINEGLSTLPDKKFKIDHWRMSIKDLFDVYFSTSSCWVQWGLEYRTPQTERHSKTERFKVRKSNGHTIRKPNAKHEPTIRKPTKLGRFTT